MLYSFAAVGLLVGMSWGFVLIRASVHPYYYLRRHLLVRGTFAACRRRLGSYRAEHCCEPWHAWAEEQLTLIAGDLLCHRYRRSRPYWQHHADTFRGIVSRLAAD